MAEELAPVHCRERPQWIEDLFKLCKSEFGRKSGSEAGLAEARKHTANFTAVLPLCLLDTQLMPIPGVYPLKGAVVQEMQHFYGDRANQTFEFPPPGTVLQVAAFKLPIEESDFGSLQRANLDLPFLAWLMRYDLALKQKDSKTVAYFRKAANRVLMDVRLLPSESEKLALAYQFREDEEKQAHIAGHSLLSRARELNSIQERHVVLDLREGSEYNSISPRNIFVNQSGYPFRVILTRLAMELWVVKLPARSTSCE